MVLDFTDDTTCERTCAMLLVSGDNIDGHEFTRLLEVAPTEAGKAGTCSCWRFSSETRVQSTNLERHIHWVLDQIADKQDVIRYLKEQKNCQIDLGCWWKGRPDLDERGPFLAQETLQRIADFHLNLIFYFLR